jgi:two-component system KDP operon response regulator KdpE
VSESAGKLLVVDDESAIRHALQATLSALGFSVSEAETGEEAISLILETQFDVALLDINMPGMGGVKACREMRKAAPGLAILMLTVRDREEDKVAALDAGADDYITKPFQMRELTARVRASVRRVRSNTPKLDGTLAIGEIEIDAAARVVQKKGADLRFTPKEFDLLHYLMCNAGSPMTHARLLNAVWGPEYGGELEYLRTFIRQIRVKLEDDPANPQYVLTRAYIGYYFRDRFRENQ